jgi:polar amino acid transport system substrate-binding protein
VSTSKRALLASLSATAVLATACGGGSEASQSSAEGGGGNYGECEVYGDAGSIKLDPVSDGVFTAQTNVAHRAGLDNVKVDNVSFDALVAGQTQDFDMAMAQISVTPEREKVVTFSAPYFDSNIGVLAPADGDISEENLTSKKIGVQLGTTAVEFAKGELAPDQEVQVFPDTTALVTAVSAGVIDAAVMDTAILLAFAKNSGGALEVVGQYESGEKYAAIYPKDSANGEPISKAIEAMREDGTLDKLSAKWLGPELGGDPAAVPVWSVQ